MLDNRILPIMAALLFLASCSSEPGGGEPVQLNAFDVARTGKPNDYLVCTQDDCSAEPDRVEAVKDIDAAVWLDALRTALQQEPRLEWVDTSADHLHATQRSAVFGFIDDIAVNVRSGEDGTHFAIYSRSRIGYSDMGVNKARVERVLDRAMAAGS